MELDIRPNDGVGPLRLGMTYEEAEAAVGGPRVPVRPRRDSFPARDMLGDSGVFIEYDSTGACVAFELSPPCDPVFRGRNVFRVPAGELRAWLRTLSPTLEEDSMGFGDLALGLGFGAPDIEEHPDRPVETVIVFEEGYFDKEY